MCVVQLRNSDDLPQVGSFATMLGSLGLPQYALVVLFVPEVLARTCCPYTYLVRITMTTGCVPLVTIAPLGPLLRHLALAGLSRCGFPLSALLTGPPPCELLRRVSVIALT